MESNRVTGVVLAGGQSRRFGRDKARLMVSGETLLARTVRIVGGVTDDVLVLGPAQRANDLPTLLGPAARQAEPATPVPTSAQPDARDRTPVSESTAVPWRIIPDDRPGDGPLPALAAALRAMHGDRLLAVATDMPLLNPRLLRWLIDRSDGYDVTVPQVGGRLQPLHAVYTRACLPHIEAQLARDDLKIDRFFPLVRTLIVDEVDLRRLDPALDSFRNVNTEADWEAIVQLVEQRSGR